MAPTAPMGNINPAPTDDDSMSTPPIPASQTTAHGVDCGWYDHDGHPKLQEPWGTPEPARMATDDTPPAPILTRNCSWGGSQVE